MQACRLNHVYMGPRDVRLARAAQVDEGQLLPGGGMRHVAGSELSTEQEFEIPVERRAREPPRSVDLRDHLGTGEHEVGQFELLPGEASGGIVVRFADEWEGRREQPSMSARLDARGIE